MQAYANKQEGVKRLSTETGAGQWGGALSCACQLMGLECMLCVGLLATWIPAQRELSIDPLILLREE